MRARTRAPPRAGEPANCRGLFPRPAAISHDVKKAIEYMRAHMHREVAMPKLTLVSGVSERTLRQHFRCFLGRSPSSYWRRMRLGALRDELLGSPKHGSITEIATRFGFHHLGRFAAEYRRCFGESPSTTLRRARTAGVSMGAHRDDHDGAGDQRRQDIPWTLRVSRERPSVVVLPFQVATANQRYFADFLAEGIACALCGVRSLAVST